MSFFARYLNYLGKISWLGFLPEIDLLYCTLLKTLTEIRTKSDTSRTCGLVFYKKNQEYRSFRLLIFLVKLTQQTVEQEAGSNANLFRVSKKTSQ